MKTTNFLVCSPEYSRGLDNRFRQWLQNPARILSPFVRPGMTCLDLGCGPGFFTLEMANLVGNNGTVIAADIQEWMIKRVGARVSESPLKNRIRIHQCENDKIGLQDQLDFVLLFYMVHETGDKPCLFNELNRLLKSDGRILMVEPRFRVSNKTFRSFLNIAQTAGFKVLPGPNIFLSQTAVFEHPGTTRIPSTDINTARYAS